jgi:small redox-active disulfide protein 2
LEETAEVYADRPENDIRVELLNRLSKRNYIPQGAKGTYGEAFLREFNKFLGRPYEERAPEELEIKVLGRGCARCDSLEQLLMEVMAEMGLAANVEYVTDLKEIGKYGLMGTPALLISGKVMSVGSVPPKERIKKWLREFQ